MRNYIFAFIFALFAGAAIVNIKAPAKMGTMVSDIKPTTYGTIHDEDGVGEVQVNEAARNWRFTDHVTSKNPSRLGEFPNFGNN